MLQAAFGRWPCDVTGVSPADFFRWKYTDKPFGRPTRLVAEIAGEVVGFNAYIPWLFRAGTRTIAAVRGVDLAVHPAHHGRGVGWR